MAVIKNKDGSITIGEFIEEKETPVVDIPTEDIPVPVEFAEETELTEDKPRNKGGRPRKN